MSRNPRCDRVNIRLNERDIRGRITKVGKKNVPNIQDKFRMMKEIKNVGKIIKTNGKEKRA